MPRLSKEQLKKVESEQRRLMTVHNSMRDVSGGFPWLAAAPFLAAASIPVLSSAGKWIGKKVFGHGLLRAGEHIPKGAGLAERLQSAHIRKPPTSVKHHRAGDVPMPKLVPISKNEGRRAKGGKHS
jgi:hypothetical protein